MADPARHDIAAKGRRLGLAVPDSLLGTRIAEGRAAELLADLEVREIDSLWVLDQLSGRHPTAEPVSLLSYVAALTARVRLGIAVYVGTARGPLAAAKSLTTLDRLSGGRLTVGLGLGAPRHYPAYGLGGTRAPAGRLFDELLDGLARLWAGEPLPREGGTWALEDVVLTPGPAQQPHPPIWIGGTAERSYQRAATFGTGWIGAGRQSLSDFARSVTSLREHVGPSRMASGDFTVSKRVYLLVTDDRARADAELRSWFGSFYGRPDLGRDVAVAGDAAHCAEQLMAHFEAGADHLILHPILETPAQYETVLRDVVTAVAAAAPDLVTR